MFFVTYCSYVPSPSGSLFIPLPSVVLVLIISMFIFLFLLVLLFLLLFFKFVFISLLFFSLSSISLSKKGSRNTTFEFFIPDSSMVLCFAADMFRFSHEDTLCSMLLSESIRWKKKSSTRSKFNWKKGVFASCMTEYF